MIREKNHLFVVYFVSSHMKVYVILCVYMRCVSVLFISEQPENGITVTNTNKPISLVSSILY